MADHDALAHLAGGDALDRFTDLFLAAYREAGGVDAERAAVRTAIAATLVQTVHPIGAALHYAGAWRAAIADPNMAGHYERSEHAPWPLGALVAVISAAGFEVDGTPKT